MGGLNLLTFLGIICLSIAADDSSKPSCLGMHDGVFLPDYTDCKKYFVCFEGQSIPGKCPSEYVFDANQQMCNVKEETECFTCPEKTLKIFRYPSACSKYVLCFNGAPIMRECLDGLQFNANTNICDFAKNVDCVTCPTEDKKNELIFHASHTQCDKYYLCNNGNPEKMTCSKGLHFNSILNECDIPKRAMCKIQEENYSLRPRTNLLDYNHMVIENAADIECPKNEIHFYPDPSNDKKYFLCVNGRSIILACSNGLIYDQKTRNCRLPNKVL